MFPGYTNTNIRSRNYDRYRNYDGKYTINNWNYDRNYTINNWNYDRNYTRINTRNRKYKIHRGTL